LITVTNDFDSYLRALLILECAAKYTEKGL